MKMKETLELFVSKTVPLVVVYNAMDLMESATKIMRTLNEYTETNNAKDYIVTWDCIRGMQVEKCAQMDWAMDLLGDDGRAQTSPIFACERIELMLKKGKESGKGYGGAYIFYMADTLMNPLNPERDSFVQYLLILRDKLTECKSTIILVGIDVPVPTTLKEHVALVSADLPTDADYETYVSDVYSAYEKGMKRKGVTEVAPLDEQKAMRLRDTLRGQTTFSAKQNLYLSIDKDEGLSLARLQERAIHTINSTKGLSVLQGDGRGFKAIAGLDGICDFSRKLIASDEYRIELVVFMDEIEKAAAGSGGTDTSGVSATMLGTWLTRTSKGSKGYLCTGVYGTGKSEFAQRFAEECNALCVSFSISDMKDSLVGNSESNIKRALDVVEAIGGGGIFWIGTSNRINQLSPETRRRFTMGTYFFDFPNKEGRDAIWKIYLKHFNLSTDEELATYSVEDMRKDEGFNDEDWTGAEIRTCCEIAHILGISIGEAAKEVTLVKNTARTEIERLQMDADGKYKDAALGGVYQRVKPKSKQVATSNKLSDERDISI